MMNIRQEDIAAENILKRAELNRITRQLKSRLSKTNLKSKLKEKSLSNPPSIVKSTSRNSLHSHLTTTPKRIQKKRSVESIDANKTEDESSPSRNHNGHDVNLPPSSPLYEEFEISVVPNTPPQQKIRLNTDIYNSSTSTNKTQINYSSPAKQSQQSQHQLLSTPKRHHDEGADLLMFLATSPSPVQYKDYPSTPSRSLHQPSSAVSSVQKPQPSNNFHSTNNFLSALNTTPHKFAAPATPKRNMMNHHFKTPGFNMNDYVNLFSPSPRISRTPGTANGGQMGSISGALSNSLNSVDTADNKDVNGKLIKF